MYVVKFINRFRFRHYGMNHNMYKKNKEARRIVGEINKLYSSLKQHEKAYNRGTLDEHEFLGKIDDSIGVTYRVLDKMHLINETHNVDADSVELVEVEYVPKSGHGKRNSIVSKKIVQMPIPRDDNYKPLDGIVTCTEENIPTTEYLSKILGKNLPEYENIARFILDSQISGIKTKDGQDVLCSILEAVNNCYIRDIHLEDKK